MVGSPGTGGRWGLAESSCLRGGVEEAEVEGRDGPGCCSTGPSSAEVGISEEVSSSRPLSLSGSGEVEEEREVVEDVEEDEEWGEVSEDEAGGRKDKW